MTGYLTRVRQQDLLAESRFVPGGIALKIPNEEIRNIFRDTILKWFEDKAKSLDRSELFSAVWKGDEQKVTSEISKILRQTISYHDYKEDFYHAFLAGIFAGAGYAVDSNKEHGEGRSDILVQDLSNGRAAVFEAKYSKSRTKLQADCETALQQIEDKQYARQFEEDYETVICFGISFFKKQCIVLVRKE